MKAIISSSCTLTTPPSVSGGFRAPNPPQEPLLRMVDASLRDVPRPGDHLNSAFSEDFPGYLYFPHIHLWTEILD